MKAKSRQLILRVLRAHWRELDSWITNNLASETKNPAPSPAARAVRADWVSQLRARQAAAESAIREVEALKVPRKKSAPATPTTPKETP